MGSRKIAGRKVDGEGVAQVRNSEQEKPGFRNYSDSFA
jgi:hypothetical protein